jgi:hypothetical protein
LPVGMEWRASTTDGWWVINQVRAYPGRPGSPLHLWPGPGVYSFLSIKH